MTTGFEDDELAAVEKEHDEAYGAAHDAWYNEQVLSKYRRRQNERQVNAFAARLIKSYVPRQGEEKDFCEPVRTKDADVFEEKTND